MQMETASFSTLCCLDFAMGTAICLQIGRLWPMPRFLISFGPNGTIVQQMEYITALHKHAFLYIEDNVVVVVVV